MKFLAAIAAAAALRLGGCGGGDDCATGKTCCSSSDGNGGTTYSCKSSCWSASSLTSVVKVSSDSIKLICCDKSLQWRFYYFGTIFKLTLTLITYSFPFHNNISYISFAFKHSLRACCFASTCSCIFALIILRTIRFHLLQRGSVKT